MSMDPFTRAVMWRGLVAAANEAGLNLKRTGFSAAIREGRDFSVGLFSAGGEMIAQGEFSPGHLGSMPSVLRHVLERYPFLEEGDGVFLNDHYMGSGHLLDCFVASPVFLEGTLVAFAVSCAHMADVGGAVPGSQAVEGIVDYYQEGLRLLPTRLWRCGEMVPELESIIRANVRLPDTVIGDINAMWHSNLTAASRVREIVAAVGMGPFRAGCTEILDISENAMRAGIAAWPDGTVQAVDYYDDCGPATEPLRVQLELTIAGDTIALNFAGSSPQTKSGMNAVKNYLDAYCFFAIKAVMDGGKIPQNAGSIRPIEVTCPEGSVLNPRRPAGGGARAIMQQRIVDVIMTALSEIVPDRVLAPSSHWANPIIGGRDSETGEQFVHYEIAVGGFGGRAHCDGVEAMAASFNIDGIPVETAEAYAPVEVLCLEFLPDSAGAGQFRGGHGVRKDIRLMGREMILTNLGERYKFAPKGIRGGGAGACGSTVLNPGTPQERSLESKGTYHLEHGDVLSFRLSGAGGYGDPAERSPAAVAADVRAGLLSPDAAERLYAATPPASATALNGLLEP